MHYGSVGASSWMGKSNALSKDHEHGMAGAPVFISASPMLHASIESVW